MTFPFARYGDHDPDAPFLPFNAVSDRDLDDILDAWLADDRIDDNTRHVYGWRDANEREAV